MIASRGRSRSMDHYISPARSSRIAVDNWLDNSASSANLRLLMAMARPSLTNHRPCRRHRRRASSFASRCDAWSNARASASLILEGGGGGGKIPSTPSPVCSPPPATSHLPPSDDDEPFPFATPDLASSCSALDGLEPEPELKREGSSKKRGLLLCEDEMDGSIRTTNYYADDDDGRLQAINEEPERVTLLARYKHARSSTSGGYSDDESSGCEDADIESLMEERIRKSVQARRLLRAYEEEEESRGMKLAAKMSRWKEAHKMKILSRLKRAEAAIDGWEKRKTAEARMEMKELEVKLDSKRTQAMQRMETKIMCVQKEAKKKRIKERNTASRRIAEVAEGFDKAAAIGKLPCWLAFHLTAC